MPIFYIIIGLLLIGLKIEVQTPFWSYKSSTPQYLIGVSFMVTGVILLKMLSS